MVDRHSGSPSGLIVLSFIFASIFILTACSFETSTPDTITHTSTPTFFIPTATPVYVMEQTATPDAPHPLPTLRSDEVQYVIQPNDSLGTLANYYGITLKQLAEINTIDNPDLIYPGQSILIPPPAPIGVGLEYKIISDDLLLNSPAVISFDVFEYITHSNSFLSRYIEIIDDTPLSGAEIVYRISQEYSVNPKLLLSLLEIQGGWLNDQQPSEMSLNYPLGMQSPHRTGLYRQLAWAADSLNRGFYLWRINGLNTWLLAGDELLSISPVINAGTAAVQYFSSLLHNYEEWLLFCGPDGLQTTYINLFGDPFTQNPIQEKMIQQPLMRLPFSYEETWSFTGGPHGGWGNGSAWAALDFAPPGTELGCFTSDSWVTAVADGIIVYENNGLVIQDLDRDGYSQTGWVVIYQHIESRDRIKVGTIVQAGDPIGHPSCEGGISSGTHVHIARRYNGEWIAADGHIPFVMDGWESRGTGRVYDGYLIREGQIVEAWADRREENQISR